MQNLYDLRFDDLQAYIRELGQPTYRAEQIWQGAYQQAWDDFRDFSTLPKSLRKKLAKKFYIGSLKKEKELLSQDGLTKKTLFRLEDGTAIETVLMAYDQRQTVCISSQVGCAMGCSFCATGNMGFTRNLTRGEIVEQVLLTAALLKENGQSLTNVVLMGMGEPFHNYQNVLDAIRILHEPRGFNFGMRRFTISTVGLVPGIKRFTAENTQINLALSLHAADDCLRSKMIPINSTYPIAEVLAACDEYLVKTKRRITIEWALIAGVNDSSYQAENLAQLLQGKLYHVNLIQLNPVKHYPGLPATDDNAAAFQEVLHVAGLPCTIRLRRGIEIQAGCGQLANQT